MFLRQAFYSLLFLGASLSALNLYADTVQDKADLAVANILFDHSQGDQEYASYRTDEQGYVHVTFAANIPDKLFSKILAALHHHPDIRDVISDKGGPSCALW